MALETFLTAEERAESGDACHVEVLVRQDAGGGWRQAVCSTLNTASA